MSGVVVLWALGAVMMLHESLDAQPLNKWATLLIVFLWPVFGALVILRAVAEVWELGGIEEEKGK